MINCILAGVGGQGTVLASKLIAQCAMNQGQEARTAETIGMAQRGGCVVSHVRIGQAIQSPILPLRSADVMVGFEPGEAVRCLPYLKPEGVLVVSSTAVQPVTASLSGAVYRGEDMLDFLRQQVKKLIIIDGEAVCARCGSSKVLNVALLGAAMQSGALQMTMEQMERTIIERLPERFHEMNIQALREGARAAKGER